MIVGNKQQSAVERPLALRMRRDLAVRRLQFGQRCYWNIKDPVALRYFQLRDEEYFILSLLDGKLGAQDIKTRFEQQFAPRKLDPRHLQGFLGMLHRQGLIVADAEGQGKTLLRRRGEERRRVLVSVCWYRAR